MQDFFATTVKSGEPVAADSDKIYLTALPTGTEGYLVLEPDDSDKREIIYYTSKGADYVQCPSVVAGRGIGGTSAQAHVEGSTVKMNFVAEYWQALKDGFASASTGWTAALGTYAYASADSPTYTITTNADVTSLLYPGVRLNYEQDKAVSYYWRFEASSAATVGNPTMEDVGTPTYTAGKYGNALTLDGSTDALSITDHADFKPTGAFTIGVWAKTADHTRTIFQSWNRNGGNYNGIILWIGSGGQVTFAADAGTNLRPYIQGTTVVTDNAFHHIAVTAKDNWVQLYVDGKLDASGYLPSPTYHATNIVEIGRQWTTQDGLSQWFKGQIDDLFFIKDVALPETAIKAYYDAGTELNTQGTTITVENCALCTASSYSAPNTTVTLYGGTDYTLQNATISNVYYSTQKAPYGFPLGRDKWTVECGNSANASQATPTQYNWYNVGSIALSVPIGKWSLKYMVNFLPADNSNYASGNVTLATVAGSGTTGETDSRMTSWVYGQYTGATTASPMVAVTREKDVSLSTKQSFYLNAKTDSATLDSISFRGDGGTTIIRATSTLI